MAVGSAQGRRRTHRLQERRSAVWQHVALVGLIAAAPATALACELPDHRRISGARHSLAFRTVPAQVHVGEPFVVEVALCPAAELRSANAQMPEHRHGMNYRPSIRATADGRYRTEGWVFHMPGRWEFAFEAGGERFVDSLRLE